MTFIHSPGRRAYTNLHLFKILVSLHISGVEPERARGVVFALRCCPDAFLRDGDGFPLLLLVEIKNAGWLRIVEEKLGPAEPVLSLGVLESFLFVGENQRPPVWGDVGPSDPEEREGGHVFCVFYCLSIVSPLYTDSRYSPSVKGFFSTDWGKGYLYTSEMDSSLSLVNINRSPVLSSTARASQS